MTRSTKNSRRADWLRGLTLIELLVVVSIMMLLVVISIPALRPAMEKRRIREATRAVNVYLSSARNRAIESGRPFGVELVRDPNLVLASRTLYQVEVPAPYAGELESTRIVVTAIPNTMTANVTFTPAEDPIAAGLIRRGDELRFEFQGRFWNIVDFGPAIPPAPDTWLFQLYCPGEVDLSSIPGTPQRFQIFRQPVRSHIAPLQLPRGMVVDLGYSGVQDDEDFLPYDVHRPYNGAFLPYNGSDQRSVVILFGSRRAVDRIYRTDDYNRLLYYRVTSPVYLLVGQQERVPITMRRINNPWAANPPTILETDPSPAEDSRSNLLDLRNFWITINHQTGYVSATEVAAQTDPTAPRVIEAREFAREFQATGGR